MITIQGKIPIFVKILCEYKISHSFADFFSEIIFKTQVNSCVVVLHSYRHSHLIDEDILVATAMIFLVVGYDTRGLTLSYAAYHLAKNPAVQPRLQADIDAAVADSDGDLPDYSVIQSGLPYLEINTVSVLSVASDRGQHSVADLGILDPDP